MAGEPTMTNRLDLFLFEAQSTFGSPATGLDGNDFLDVEEGSSLENDMQMDTVTSVEGSFGQPPQVPGNMPSAVTLNTILRTGGDDDPGYAMSLLECGGFLKSNAAKVHSYDPTSIRTSWKDGTLWHYTGDRTASGALREIAYNVMFDNEITLTPGKVGRMVSTGKGAHSGPATDQTQPSVTRNTQLAAAVLGSTVSIMGYAYKFLEVKITTGFEVSNTMDVAATYGHGHTIPADLMVKWTAKLYAVTAAEADAFTQLVNGTTAAWSIQWGTAPNKYTMYSPNNKAQITSRKKSEQDRITTLDLEGIFQDNDFTIDVDTTP